MKQTLIPFSNDDKTDRFDRMFQELLEIPKEELHDDRWEGCTSDPRSVRITILQRQRLMKYHADLLAAVSKSLFHHDPFRLNYGYNFDEYDGEAARIVHLIARREPLEQLMDKTHSHLEDSCGITKESFVIEDLIRSVVSDYEEYKKRHVEESSVWSLETIPQFTDLPETWRALIEADFSAKNYAEIKVNLLSEVEKSVSIYPPPDQVFRAFRFFEPKDTKVIILGQDPYPQRGYANGLAFGVHDTVSSPNSLSRILKKTVIHDRNSECGGVDGLMNGYGKADHSLLAWVRQGVLLLNTVLTVPEGTPGGHKQIGWKKMTESILRNLWKQNGNIVVMLWGTYANRIGNKVFGTGKAPNILRASHPVASRSAGLPLFSKTNHFCECNTFLLKKMEAGELPYDSILW